MSDELIAKYLSSPDENIEELVSLMTYMYISDGSIYQLYELLAALPRLNYKVKVFDRTQTDFQINLAKCDQVMYQVGYKKLCRSIIKQLSVTGNVCCIWLGSKSNPYLYIFSSDEYTFGGFKRNNDWVCMLDMAKFEDMKEPEQLVYFETFKSIGLQRHYKKYLNNKEKFKYMELPQDKTHLLRVNTLYDNQRKGLPYGTPALQDLSHKAYLRKLEKNIIEKVIKTIAKLTIGNKDIGYEKVNPAMRKKIISSVKSAMQKAMTSGGIPTTILPEYADLEIPNVDGLDVFKADSKFNEVNNGISSDIGISASLTGGSGSNYQTSKINLDMLYTRIDLILEELEPLFKKLFDWVLTKKMASNFGFSFVKGQPLSKKDKVDLLMKLHTEGTSFKSVIDEIDGVDYLELIEDSIYENEVMELGAKIIPHQTSYTMSGDNTGGAPTIEEPDNPNTVASQASGGNLGGDK